VRLAGQDVQAMNREQRLLRQLVTLARRCEGRLPPSVLDELLSGTGPVRPVLPGQRRPRTP
jgi:hypothetical protein